MSTTSPKSYSAARQVAYSTISLLAVLLLVLLAETQHALPISARPVEAAALLLRPARLLSSNPKRWHTEGAEILDAHDQPFHIAGVNWSGLETKEAVPGGLEAQDYRAILQSIKAKGFNTVRIPFSNEMVEMSSVPNRISFSNATGSINADLRDRTSLEILDRIVAYAGRIGLKIILDNHRSEAGSSAEESGLWYSDQFPESAWIADWTELARRYENEPAVIGMDLRNEPHNAEKGGSCWDCGGMKDWHKAAQRAGNAILAVNPRLLIFVEGVDTYEGDSYWWGGNLEGVRRSPVRLAVPNHLVYSAHEYGPAEYAQPWFNDATSPSTLAALWRRHWGYISESGIAPVWIGEFGTPNNDVDVQSSLAGSEGQWFGSLVKFLGSDPQLGWTYWGINGEDRYGLLDVTYSHQPANKLKAEALASISRGAAVTHVAQPLYTAGSTLENRSGFSVVVSEPVTAYSASISIRSRPVRNGDARNAVPSHRAVSLREAEARSTSGATEATTMDPAASMSVKIAIAASVHDATRLANSNIR